MTFDHFSHGRFAISFGQVAYKMRYSDMSASNQQSYFEQKMTFDQFSHDNFQSLFRSCGTYIENLRHEY